VDPGHTANVLVLAHMTMVAVAPNLREENLYGAASDFLAGTLKQIEERRTKWSQSKTRKVWLDGHVGARAEWTGNLDGRPTIGVTYCLIVGNHGYYFNAFGIGTEPNAALKSSIRAIEGLRVAKDQSDALVAAAEMRARVLALQPADIGITKATHPQYVWGILMETGAPEGGAVGLVALADGTTSLYFPPGGGVIKGGQHERVRSASRAFLVKANEFRNFASPASAHPLPGAGQVIFYFLSYGGVLSCSAPEVSLGEGRDRLSALFLAGRQVTSEMNQAERARHAASK
jgi:hypothetical protein